MTEQLERLPEAPRRGLIIAGRHISNELAVLVGAIALLTAIAFAAVFLLPEASQQRQSISNRSDDGISRLREWFIEEGFDVQRITADPIDPSEYDVLFVLNPPGRHSNFEATTVYEWVRNGGKLIVVSSTQRVNTLLEPFDVAVSDEQTRSFSLSLTAPTLTDPALEQVPVRFANIITTERRDAVVHLADQTDAVLISFQEGDGEVYVSGTVYPFTNNGLSLPASPRLVSNIMAGATPGETRIGFDEAQLPTDDGALPPNLFVWILSSTAGRGVLLLMTVIFVYLLSAGRRFGAPVPLLEDRLRREPVEYIVAMANLFRRSGRRKETMQHYKSRLRRRLSERYTIDPSLRDERFAAQAAGRDGNINEDQLAALLQRLSKDNPTEAELLSAAADVQTWLQRYGAR